MQYLYQLGESLAYVLVAVLFLILIKLITDFFVNSAYNADLEIEEHSNIAIALRRGGLYLGFAIGFAGSLSGDGHEFSINTILVQIIDFVLIMLFIFSSFFVADKVLISKIHNTTAVKDGNVAVGAAEMGLFLATGIIASASFSGEGSIVSSIVFFFLGQIVLVLVSLLYEMITRYSVQDELKRGNSSAGVMLAGVLVSLSVILYAAISGPSNDLGEDIISFTVSAVIGIVLVLIFFNQAMDKLFFANTNLEKEIEVDQNLAAIFVTVCIKVSLAFIIASVLL